MPATAALTAAGASYEVRVSTSLAHAAELAAQAAAAGEVIVAVGGDGMAGALAGAAARSGGTLGIIPAGRGNDLARVLGIPLEPAAAATRSSQAPPGRSISSASPGQMERR